MSETTPTGGTIEVNGAEIWCEASGDGPPLMLVHAGICDSRMWDPQVAAFRPDHRVVRYDMRGFGRSTIPPEPFAHHADLAALFDALALPASVVIGASYGGNVATEFALEHPERVWALIIVNSLVGMAAPSPRLRAGWNAVDDALRDDDIERAIEIETRMWVDGPLRSSDQVDAGVRSAVATMNAAILSRRDEIDAAEEREMEPLARHRLADLQVPVLVVVGELDQPDALASADALIAGIPGARRASVPDAAHLPSMERVDPFNRIVRDFLESL